MTIRAVPSVGVRALQMSDGPVGVRLDSGFPSTTYAGGIALAASWDRELAQRVGAGIGRDARARGINFMLGPAREYLSLPAQWPQLRILRRRSVSYLEHRRRLHQRHAGAGRQLDDQTLRGQQLRVSAPRLGLDHRCAHHARDLSAGVRGRGEEGACRRRHGLLQPDQRHACHAEWPH